MTRPRMLARGWPLLLVAVATAGCDLYGDYALRVDEAASQAPPAAGAGGGGAAGGLHADPTPINSADGKPLLSIKLPALFSAAESQWLVTGGKDRGGKDVTADRANPPGLAIPGWSATYEVALDNGAGQKLPVYVYFYGAAGAGEAAETAATTALSGEIAKANAGQPAAWNPVGNPPWKRAEFRREMPFDGSQAGGADVNAAGKCEIFVTSSGTHIVTVVWRRPDAVEAKAGFDAAVTAAMASAILPSPRPGPGVPGVPPMGP